MIVLSNTTAQTLAVGESITFNLVVLHTGNGECHRANTKSVKLRQFGIYDVSFNGNVSVATAGGQAILAIQAGGETLPETTIISTSSAAGEVNNVAARTRVKNCCCDYDRLTVTNIGTEAVTVEANSSFNVRRES